MGRRSESSGGSGGAGRDGHRGRVGSRQAPRPSRSLERSAIRLACAIRVARRTRSPPATSRREHRRPGRRACRRAALGGDRPARAATQYAGFLGTRISWRVARSVICCFARRFDLTQSQANIVNVGAFAGGLVGVAAPVLHGRADSAFAFGAAAAAPSSEWRDLRRVFQRRMRRRRNGSEQRSRGRDGNGARFAVRPRRPRAQAASAACAVDHVLARLRF